MTNLKYDNIWDAIEPTEELANLMKLKSQLMMEIHKHISDNKWTLEETAKHLNVDNEVVSFLLDGRINLFTLKSLEIMRSNALYSLLQIEKKKYETKLLNSQENLSKDSQVAWDINSLLE